MNGQRIGHITIVPLHPKILESFVQGTIREEDIKADSLYQPVEQHLVKNIYVESLIIDSPNGHSTLPIKALTCLAHDFIPLLSRVCNPTNLENVYALAASGRGESFMKRLGFVPVKSDKERPDQRALYVAKFCELQTNISALYNRRLSAPHQNREL